MNENNNPETIDLKTENGINREYIKQQVKKDLNTDTNNLKLEEKLEEQQLEIELSQDLKKEEENESFLEKLDQKLNSRGRNNYDEIRTKMTHLGKKPDFNWSADVNRVGGLEYDIQYESIKKNFSFLTLGTFIFSFILMLGALVYAFWTINYAGNVIRQDKIDIKLDMPSFTEAGKALNGKVIVSNSNRSSFLDAYISLDVINKEDGLSRNVSQLELGDVDSGQIIHKNFELNLIGKEGETQPLILTLFYKVPGSESVFQKTLSQNVLITKSPITVSILGPRNLSLEQEGEYIIKVRGVSQNLQNVHLELNTPKQMFILNPNYTEVVDNIFDLGQIKEGQEKEFRFKGVFKDIEEITDKLTIKARIGELLDGELVNSFAESIYGITLETLPISVAVSVDQQSGTKILFNDKEPKAKIIIKNESNNKMKNAKLEIKVSGGLFNSKSLFVKGAEYNSATAIIYANKEVNPNYAELEAGDDLEIDLDFKNLSTTNYVSNKNLTLDIMFQAESEGSTGLPLVKKYLSVLQPKQLVILTAEALYYSGSLKNFGPIPPKVGTTTSYTVTMKLESEGGIKDGKVSLKIPSNVTFIKSLDNKLGYDSLSRKIIWLIGDIPKPSNNLVQLERRDVAFQVSIIPTPDQVKRSPALAEDIIFEAVDEKGDAVKVTASQVTTNISTDPKYVSNKNMDIVIE